MENNNNQYWKGLEELHREEEFEKHRYNEFAEKLPIGKVVKEEDLELTSNRRDFLKYMGFGISAATLAACSRSPIKKVVPYINKPVDVDPGVPNYYATTCSGCNAKCSILVKTREGRPIKIEGNYESPVFKGGVCAVGQGTVLDLYDNSRLTGPKRKGKDISWSEMDAQIINNLKKAVAAGKSIRILSGTISSPSTLNVINDFIKKYPGTQHVQYDASSASALRIAHQQAFGKALVPNYRIDQAKTLVSFDADFLGTWISPVEYTKLYVSARKADSKPEDFLNHIQFEGHLSLSGTNADMRVPVNPSQMGQALVKLYNLLVGYAGGTKIENPSLELAGNSIENAAKQLWKNRGKSIVLCGTNDVDHQLVTAAINSMLGNYGNTIDIDNPSYQKQGNDKDMINLVNDMNAGTVGALIVYDANPYYTYPDAAKFKSGLEKVDVTISFAERMDETADHIKYVAPDHHFLESWGDDMPKEGYVSLMQPTISPIFDTRSAQESLLAWMETPMAYYDYVRKYWQENMFPKHTTGGNFEEFWMKTLELGFMQMNARPVQTRSAATIDIAGSGSRLAKAPAKGEMEIIVYEKVAIRDGKNSNNPWLQELPDPVSKVSWDNYACVSPKWAEEKGLNDEDLVEIKTGDKTITLPVLRQPGQRYGTVAVAKGYGRNMANKDAAKVAHGIGANAYPFATITADTILYSGQNVEVKAKGGTYPLALSQTHHHMEGRDLVRETTLAELASNKEAHGKAGHGGGGHQLISLWKDYRFPGHHWGMAIDLNACTGCSACVVSCNAENNIPVVGKDEVRRRREMHWLRIDRYYSIEDTEGKMHGDYKDIDAQKENKKLGNYENVKVVFQPILCQHCSNAPCESVCPVNAISHSSEGLNQQAYNRCVGTRYCANNCPYKVRRFNWFNYAKNESFKDFDLQTDLGRMVLNPDVTVRTRGVMEKCSFCVQRIQLGKLSAKKDGRAVKDGEVKTACQQVCPANAIVFGDMNDPNSEVSKLIANKRTYAILTELNTRPAVNYMSKVRFTQENLA